MKYKTILADPPWSYSNRHIGGRGQSGAVDKYKTMSLDEICRLDIIDKITDKDCTLFLWTTSPHLHDAFHVMGSWGFNYKQTIIWLKTGVLGMGFWFRVQYELCLLGTRGKVLSYRSSRPNVFFANITGHSRKPDKFFGMIEKHIDKPAIELFAREKREGWDAWGDEI